MVRPMNDLILLREIENKYKETRNLREVYPEKIVIIKHTAYIKKDALPNEIVKEATDLTNYLPISVIAEVLSLNKQTINTRINFMEETNHKIFDYKKIAGMYFIKLCEEMMDLFINYQPVVISYADSSYIKKFKLLGDLRIGFY